MKFDYSQSDLTAATTLRLPFAAAAVCDFLSESQLKTLAEKIHDFERFFILSGGSNSVVLPFFDGLLIRVQNKGIEIAESDDFFHLNIAAGEKWAAVVRFALNCQIFGLESLAGIPGLIGAAAVQNIGAYGSEIADFVEALEVFDLKEKKHHVFLKNACDFAYRHSRFKTKDNSFLVFRVKLKIPKKWQYQSINNARLNLTPNATPFEVFDCVLKTRAAKLPDPSIFPNAGSFFKNPTVNRKKFSTIQNILPNLVFWENGENFKLSAAFLIESAGLKGKTLQGFAMSQKHALVLENKGGSRADLDAFVLNIQQIIQQKYGVFLETEPVFM